MDHLFLPLGAVSEAFVYPGRTNYIAIPFLEYPMLAEKSVYLQAQEGDSSRFRDLWGSEDPPDETEFFATWLFCGLIQEILDIVPQQLGEASLYRHEYFVRHRTDHNGREIGEAFSTEKLMSLLEQWSKLIEYHKHKSKEQHDHLKLCMNMTHSLLTWKSAKIEHHVKAIIAATAELLCVTIESAFNDAEFISTDSEFPNTWSMFFKEIGWQSALLANGWCPSEA